MLAETNCRFQEVPVLRDGWEALSRSGAPVFQTWEWLCSWWEYYGAGQPLILYRVSGEGKLEAAVPLVIKRRTLNGVSLRSVELIGSGESTPDHLVFLAGPSRREEFAADVFRYLAAHSSLWDVIRLTDMLPDQSIINAARSVFADKLRIEPANKGVCPYIALPEEWQKYTATLSRGTRQKMGKYERDLVKKFKVRFLLCGQQDELSPMLARLEELHRGRMALKNPSSLTLDHRFWMFQEKFAGKMLDSGKLFLHSLELDGKVAACMFGFVHERALTLYLSGIDPSFEKYSVGFVNIAHLIQEALKRGLREVDFLRGDEPYKFYFARHSRDNSELIVWNRTLRSLMAGSLGASRARIKKMIRKENGEERREEDGIVHN